MHRNQHSFWARVALCLCISACSVKSPPPRPIATPALPPVKTGWIGAQAQVAIVEFDDQIRGRVLRRGNLLGRGMEAQLVTALRQAGQFSVLEPQEKTVRGKKGEPMTAQVGSHEEPEFF